MHLRSEWSDSDVFQLHLHQNIPRCAALCSKYGVAVSELCCETHINNKLQCSSSSAEDIIRGGRHPCLSYGWRNTHQGTQRQNKSAVWPLNAAQHRTAAKNRCRQVSLIPITALELKTMKKPIKCRLLSWELHHSGNQQHEHLLSHCSLNSRSHQHEGNHHLDYTWVSSSIQSFELRY